MKENARQGFWNGSRPPLGYRVIIAEQRGAKLKKKLEIDPIQAEKVRNLAISAQLERLQTGVQTSLLFVEQAGEQDNRRPQFGKTIPTTEV